MPALAMAKAGIHDAFMMYLLYSYDFFVILLEYRKLWLLGACVYNFQRNFLEKLTLFIKLTHLRLWDTADTGNKIIITDHVFICIIL